MTDQPDTKNEPTAGNREQVQLELQDLPDEHLEQVLHHVRQLKDINALDPSPPLFDSSERGASSSGLELVWKCTRCGAILPRSHQQPESCPDCSAPREDLVLHEED